MNPFEADLIVATNTLAAKPVSQDTQVKNPLLPEKVIDDVEIFVIVNDMEYYMNIPRLIENEVYDTIAKDTFNEITGEVIFGKSEKKNRTSIQLNPATIELMNKLGYSDEMEQVNDVLNQLFDIPTNRITKDGNTKYFDIDMQKSNIPAKYNQISVTKRAGQYYCAFSSNNNIVMNKVNSLYNDLPALKAA
jgi:hypothetical protein